MCGPDTNCAAPPDVIRGAGDCVDEYRVARRLRFVLRFNNIDPERVENQFIAKQTHSEITYAKNAKKPTKT